MSWIMTEFGWRQHVPPEFTLAPQDDGRYRGPLPATEPFGDKGSWRVIPFEGRVPQDKPRPLPPWHDRFQPKLLLAWTQKMGKPFGPWVHVGNPQQAYKPHKLLLLRRVA